MVLLIICGILCFVFLFAATDLAGAAERLFRYTRGKSEMEILQIRLEVIENQLLLLTKDLSLVKTRNSHIMALNDDILSLNNKQSRRQPEDWTECCSH